MDRNRRNKIIFIHIIMFILVSFCFWLLYHHIESSGPTLINFLPIAALIALIIFLLKFYRSELREQRTVWQARTRELELQASQRSEELNHKNIQLRTVLEDIRHLGYYDALTNLPNRRLLIKHMLDAIANASQSNKMVAVLFVDLDNFKIINDTMGHSLGDLVLKELGTKIKNSVRKKDFVSRQGGDEFTLLLPELVNMEQVIQLIREIHQRIQEPFIINDIEIHIETSIGVALYPRHGDDIDNLIKCADIAMYHAKGQGKNKFAIYTPEMNQAYLRKLSINKQLRSAIQNEEFSLFYQPQVRVDDGQIIGIESLVRWNNPALGDVTPSELIPIAEENGQIIPLGEWVLLTACRHLKSWLDEGYAIPKVAVNISPVQFRDEKLVDSVKRILLETGLEPQYLELEITEGVALYNEKGVLNKLVALKDIGIKVALDDFGTGYSCLAYLAQYPVDTLKIDRSFIKDILHNLDNRILVETMIIMAHNFDIDVVAEGIDTTDHFELLKDYKCDAVQGFLISPPVSAEELKNLMRLYSGKRDYYQAIS
ncbi:MAG: EAL domain-containing protein [Syntrophomonadaceae bacterium]|nr:EAL domain-containing protein [Syntrophomonadaceae bacterium]